MFKGTLRSLISNFDEHNTLWRSLLQEMENHGADSKHLDDLLEDAKGKRSMLRQIIRVIMPIWNLVDKPVTLSLRAEDFQIPVADFVSNYSTKINPEILRSINLVEAPSLPCRYRLYRFPSPTPEREIFQGISVWKGKRPEYAGWRELLAYVDYVKANNLLTGNNLATQEIVSAGSRRDHVGHAHFLPGAFGGGEIIMGWSVVDSQRSFFLIRDFNN